MQNIIRFIGRVRQNPVAALRLLRVLEESFGELARLPALGHRRPDLTDDPAVYFYTVRKNYMVAFVREAGGIFVLRVFHGAQNIQHELGAEE